MAVEIVRVFLSACAGLFALHALSGMYAVSTSGWWQKEISTAGSQSRASLSPFFSCSSVSGSYSQSCSKYEATAYTSGSCTVSKGDAENYMTLVRVFVISPGGFSLLGMVLALVGVANSSSNVTMKMVPPLVAALLALACNAVGVALTIVNFKKMYCDDSPCAGVSNCKMSWQGSALLFFCSGIFPLVSVALLIVGLANSMRAPHIPHPQPSPHHPQPIFSQGSPSYGFAPHSQQQTSFTNLEHAQPMANGHRGATPREIASPSIGAHAEAPTHAPKLVGNANPNDYSVAEEMQPPPSGNAANGAPTHPEGFELPEGDWQWDAASNMYWSESQYLFLNPLNSHFYDPNSNHWYNAETEAWYPAE